MCEKEVNELWTSERSCHHRPRKHVLQVGGIFNKTEGVNSARVSVKRMRTFSQHDSMSDFGGEFLNAGRMIPTGRSSVISNSLSRNIVSVEV